MPRPRKAQPLPHAPVLGVPVFVAAPRTRVLIRAVADDHRDAVTEAAERAANECIAMLEASGSTILSVATQAVCVERFTRWQVVITIVYKESTSVVA